LEREFNLALIATAPSVEYMVNKTNGEKVKVDNPADLPATVYIGSIEEPFFRVSIITPKDYTGSLMELCQDRRGELIKLEYLSPERVDMQYKMPLAEVVVDFFDQLKSRSQGYASLDYELDGYRVSDLVRVDILLNALPADAFSTIVHRDKAYDYGNRMCAKLRELIPRQMFDVPIQAAIGGRIIARETVKTYWQSVTAEIFPENASCLKSKKRERRK
jgi:GTP-binding protein LepA